MVSSAPCKPARKYTTPQKTILDTDNFFRNIYKIMELQKARVRKFELHLCLLLHTHLYNKSLVDFKCHYIRTHPKKRDRLKFQTLGLHSPFCLFVINKKKGKKKKKKNIIINSNKKTNKQTKTKTNKTKKTL